MKNIIIQVYVEMVERYGSSVDDILVTPRLRQAFVAQMQQVLGQERDEETLLRKLHNMRKQSQLPKSREL